VEALPRRKKMMSQETILVTGAAGSVGSTARTAIATLLEQGHRVRAIVRKLDAELRLRELSGCQ
jgi:nucleoside-diphosphate-sugar epimerase